MPGSFELPVVAKAMAKSGKFDAVVAIGAVVSSRAPPTAGCHPPGHSGNRGLTRIWIFGGRYPIICGTC